MKLLPICFLFFVFICSANTANAAEKQKVVATIKPIHSMVAAIMEGTGDAPVLLVDGAQSMHDFSLKPSQVKAIHEADVLFYIDGNLESFAANVLKTAPKSLNAISLAKEPGIAKLPVRWVDDGDVHHHPNSSYDMHIWARPLNAKLMVMGITRELSKRYPEHREQFFANQKKFLDKLDAMNMDFLERSAKINIKPFVVFHDAFQYFESTYQFNAVATVMFHPEHGISAKHLSEVRKKIEDSKAVCVFSEPQFDKKIVDGLLAGTQIKTATIDPEGALLKPGADLYFDMMESMMRSLESCLASAA